MINLSPDIFWIVLHISHAVFCTFEITCDSVYVNCSIPSSCSRVIYCCPDLSDFLCMPYQISIFRILLLLYIQCFFRYFNKYRCNLHQIRIGQHNQVSSLPSSNQHTMIKILCVPFLQHSSRTLMDFLKYSPNICFLCVSILCRFAKD